MPIVHGAPPEQNWARTEFTAQEILNLVSADLNNDGIPDVLDVRIIGANLLIENPTWNLSGLEIKNDVGNPIPMVSTLLGDGAVSPYGEAPLVAANTDTTIVSLVVPSGKTFYLRHASASGENVARFWLEVDGATVDTQRSAFGNYNVKFTFEASEGERGLAVLASKVVRIRVRHKHPEGIPGDFDGKLYGILI